MAGVKGLAVVFLGMVFGATFSGCLQAENSLQSGNGLAVNLVFRSWGNPAHRSDSSRSFSVLVPGAMGQGAAKYQE